MERDRLETVFAQAPLLLMEGALGERLKLFGGCCGTDASHLRAMAARLTQN